MPHPTTIAQHDCAFDPDPTVSWETYTAEDVAIFVNRTLQLFAPLLLRLINRRSFIYYYN